MDRSDFSAAFEGFRPSLRSYLARLTTQIADAEDLVQETWLRAERSLDSFRGSSSLKTWVFTIATNLARDRARFRQRWKEDIQDRCRASTQADNAKVQHMLDLVAATPVAAYEFKEHLSYCFTCISKTLPEHQQLTVLLKEVYGFSVPDIVEILESSPGKVKHALAEGRHTLSDIYDRRCTLVGKTGACWECSEMAGFVNPKAVQHQHLKELADAEAPSDRMALPDRQDLTLSMQLRLALVESSDPVEAVGATIHDYLLSLMPAHAQDSPH